MLLNLKYKEKNLNLLNESNKKALNDKEEHIIKLKNSINQYHKYNKNIYQNKMLNNINDNIMIYNDKINNLNYAYKETKTKLKKKEEEYEQKINELNTKIKTRQKMKEKYMLTPCHHLFHTKCLESWLNVKNQCPCCRQRIPPLED